MKSLVPLLIGVMASFSGVLGQQALGPTWSASYFGEFISHPGVRIGVSYPFNSRHVHKVKKDREWNVVRSLNVQPSVGGFYHRRYQTGLFLLPELAFQNRSERGGAWGIGFGLGYLKTFVPNSFEVASGGSVSKKFSGHHYALTSVFALYGRTFSRNEFHEWAWYVKPQLMAALPNFPTLAGYFVLELGVTFTSLHE